MQTILVNVHTECPQKHLNTLPLSYEATVDADGYAEVAGVSSEADFCGRCEAPIADGKVAFSKVDSFDTRRPVQNFTNGTVASMAVAGGAGTPLEVVVIDDNPNLGHAGPLHNNLDGDKVLVMILADNGATGMKKGETFFASGSNLIGDLAVFRP